MELLEGKWELCAGHQLSLAYIQVMQKDSEKNMSIKKLWK